MPLFGISADHIAPQGGAFEPQRTNNFQIVFPFDGQAISASLESVTFPKPGINPLTVRFQNEERHVGVTANFSAITLVLKDFIGNRAVRALRTWRRIVYNPATGVIGLARNYKRQMTLRFFGPDGSHPRTWLLIGCWPSAVTPGSPSMGSGANNTVRATIEIDKAIFLG